MTKYKIKFGAYKKNYNSSLALEGRDKHEFNIVNWKVSLCCIYFLRLLSIIYYF